MQQIDRTGMQLRNDLLQGFCLIRLVICHPIPMGKAPEYGAITEGLIQCQELLAENTGRAAEQVHVVVKVFFDVVVETHDILSGSIESETGHAVCWMGIAVIADNVSLIDHALYQLRLRFRIGHRDEEDSADILFFQNIQNLRCVAIFIAFVKGQIDRVCGAFQKVSIQTAVSGLVGDAAGRTVELIPLIGSISEGNRGVVQCCEVACVNGCCRNLGGSRFRRSGALCSGF